MLIPCHERLCWLGVNLDFKNILINREHLENIQNFRAQHQTLFHCLRQVKTKSTNAKIYKFISSKSLWILNFHYMNTKLKNTVVLSTNLLFLYGENCEQVFPALR